MLPIVIIQFFTLIFLSKYSQNTKSKKKYILDIFVSFSASFQKKLKFKNIFSTYLAINTYILKLLINS
jgi:hypothetical protein